MSAATDGVGSFSVNIGVAVPATLHRHPALADVWLVGSRANDQATEYSDWDFAVTTTDFASLARDLAGLLAPLHPLSQQWDRLSERYCWMLMLRGPTKVDLIFVDEPHAAEPTWEPAADTLNAIDAHFWDWMLWLRGKRAKGETELVADELRKLFVHLLSPLGVSEIPSSISEAVSRYRDAREVTERRLGRHVQRALEHEVAPALAGW
jgi:hypothetical protein